MSNQMRLYDGKGGKGRKQLDKRFFNGLRFIQGVDKTIHLRGYIPPALDKTGNSATHLWPIPD